MDPNKLERQVEEVAMSAVKEIEKELGGLEPPIQKVIRLVFSAGAYWGIVRGSELATELAGEQIKVILDDIRGSLADDDD